MNLKRILLLEISVVIIVIIAVIAFIEITPYLVSSKQNNQIGVFNQRIYAQETVTLQPGARAASRFNYTTYDPAILVVDLNFQNWQRPGYLSVYCNGRLIVSFDATSKNPDVQITSVTFSGYDLVKPPPPKIGVSLIFAYGNEISFLSPENQGYAGTFSYQISVRGSR